MKKLYKAFKISGIFFGGLLVVGIIALWILLFLYRDPKEPNRNNWTEKLDISINRDDVVHSVFQCAENYLEDIRLCAVDCSLDATGVEKSQTYIFCVPEEETLLDGTLTIWVDMQEEKIVFIEMDYDRSGKCRDATMDEEAAKETQKRVSAFCLDLEWDDDVADIRIVWYYNTINIWTKNEQGSFLWDKTFMYSNGEYIEVQD